MAAAVLSRYLIVTMALVSLAAETIEPINDLRIGVTVQMSPTISEVIAPETGEAKRYNWEGGKSWGLRYDLLYVHGSAPHGRPQSGLLWAIGGSYGDTKNTPSRYDVGNGTADNTRQDIELQYRQYGGTLGLGWASLPTDTELGDFHWEILALGRAGVAKAQTVAPGLRAARGDGDGFYWEAGPTLGMALTSRDWIFGVNVGWTYGRSSIGIDLPSNSTSTLTVIRNGAEGGAQIGYRF